MITLFTLSIILQTLIINKIAKQAIYTSFTVAILRSFGSILYTDVFKDNDIVVHWFPAIKACNGFFLFDFHKIGSVLYCSKFITNIRGINLIYGIIGCLSISLLINLGEKIYKKNTFLNPNLNENSFEINVLENYNLIKISQLLLLFDPVGISYSSVLGKDVYLFATTVCILYLLHYKSFSVFIFSLPIIFTCFKDRPYVLLFLSAASLLALCLPKIKFKNFFKIINFNLPKKISSKVKLRSLFILIIFIPSIFFMIYRVFLNSYITEFNLFEIISYLDYWNVDMKGGVLNYSSNLPFPIKYSFFWFLPLPFLQSGLGSVIFGISTLNYLYFIKEIIKKGLIINDYKIKFLFTVILVFSTLFSYISFNSGITTRYKFTSCIPPLYIIFIYSNLQETQRKIKIFNNAK